MKKKKKKWIKTRHKVVRNILYVILKPYSEWKYNIKIDKLKDDGKRSYLILMNHQTAFDQFFVGISFKQTIYYLASEDLFSNGFVSSLIRFLAAPIPIKKQTTDATAVKNCMRVAKEGGSIAIAPEGNRTFSGQTEYINPAIIALAKKINFPIALYRIEGGYGVQPRWSDVKRKGKMHSYVSRVIEPEEYNSLTNEELTEIILSELYVNEAVADGQFPHRKSAEYLERAMYVCPECGLSEFESHGKFIECKKCHKKIKYTSTKELKGVGCDFPFPFVLQWYKYQCDFINNLDLSQYNEKAMYNDTGALSQVILYKNKKSIRKKADIRLYGNRITIDENSENPVIFDFDKVTAVSVLGRNKLNIYYEDKVYQIKSHKRFNALKYVNIYYRYKNIKKGDANGKFLGL